MSTGAGMKKILVADVPHMDGRYGGAFGGCELRYVRTVAEACQALAQGAFDLVAVGVYFDDSQMFDLIRAIRQNYAAPGLPIICVRGHPGFTAVTTRTLEFAVKTLGANEFIDLVHFADEAAGNAALRAAADALCAS
jgi:DNA-binding NtrC family response regulator